MQFLYILTLQPAYYDPDQWTQEAQRAQEEHFNYLKNLFETGVMKHVGRTDMPMGHKDLLGYAIFEAASEDAAQKIMYNDPAVRYGLMSGSLFPYKIVFNEKSKS